MLLITCPVTRTDELVAERRVRAVTNHPTHVALTVACPCGGVHVYRTGRRWKEARARLAARAGATVEEPARARV
jgi:thiamine monophosphate synthase